MYWQKARILEDKKLYENALETLSDVIFIIEQKFGRNNKILFQCNKRKAKLILMLSRNANKDRMKFKQNQVFKINTSQKRISDNGALVYLKNNKSLNIKGSKRIPNQKLNRSNNSNQEIDMINRKATMLIERTLNNPDNIIPVHRRPKTAKKNYSKTIGGKAMGRSKLSNLTSSSKKPNFKPFSSSSTKLKSSTKSSNRYEKSENFVPISPFTQLPVKRAIFSTNDQTRSYNQSDNASSNLIDAQKQLIDYSSIFNQEISLNLLNRPLNDEEIKQIIKNRVQKTIEAVEEAKRDHLASRYSNEGSLPQDYYQNAYAQEKPKPINYVPKTDDGDENEFERMKDITLDKQSEKKRSSMDDSRNNATNSQNLINFETFTIQSM